MENIQFDNEIAWDGKALSIWAVTHGIRILCQVPRDTNHSLSVYNDAIEREIERDRHEIFERFRPALAAKIALHAVPTWIRFFFSQMILTADPEIRLSFYF